MWAPWRMEFITSGTKAEGCVFCSLPGAPTKHDPENLILHRGKHAFVILNKYPYNNGHLMVVPFAHTADFASLAPEVGAEIFLLGQSCVRALAETYQAEGYNLGMNLGAAGGAGIKEHLHLHVLPRWVGDTNFLPVLGETKSMPQHLRASYDALAGYFRKL